MVCTRAHFSGKLSHRIRVSSTCAFVKRPSQPCILRLAQHAPRKTSCSLTFLTQKGLPKIQTGLWQLLAGELDRVARERAAQLGGTKTTSQCLGKLQQLVQILLSVETIHNREMRASTFSEDRL